MPEQDRQIGVPAGNLVLDLFVLHQRVGDLMEATLHGTGVRPAEFAVYSQLAGGPSTPRELRARLGVTASTLTGHLAALERRGHIRRIANPADGRSHSAELTASGRRTLTACQVRFREMLGELDATLDLDVDATRELLVRIDRAAAEVAARLGGPGHAERPGSE